MNDFRITYDYSASIQFYIHILTPSNLNKKTTWRHMMKINVLGAIAVLSIFATSNVMAADHRHNKHVNTNKHVATKHVKNKRIAIAQHNQPSKKVVHTQSNNSNNKLGILVTGIVVGSILSAR